MQSIVFETVGEHGRRQREGFLVPDTDELLVVDQRYPPADADSSIYAEDAYEWIITHRPTGFMVFQLPYTEATTKARAAGLAQGFYRECHKLGVDLRSSEANAIIAKVNGLPKTERLQFWERVQAYEDFLELGEETVDATTDVSAPPV
jgi:hypothetical protein